MRLGSALRTRFAVPSPAEAVAQLGWRTYGRPATGAGRLLEEPAVLFRGQNHKNLTLYDRVGDPLGETVRSSGRRRRVGYSQRFEYRDLEGACVFVLLDLTVAVRISVLTKYRYMTCWPDGTEVATIQRTTRTASHQCQVDAPKGEPLGFLRHERDGAVWELEDASGRMVARVAHRGWFWSEKVDYLVEFLVDHLPLELRLAALSAATIADHEFVEYRGGGGA